MPKKKNTKKSQPHNSHSEGLEKSAEQIHTLEFYLEILLAVSGIILSVFFGGENQGGEHSNKKLWLTCAAAIGLILYKNAIQKKMGKTTTGARHPRVFAQLLRHSLLYLGIGLISYWLANRFVSFEAWVQEAGHQTPVLVFFSLVVCSLWFTQHFAYNRIKSENRKTMRERLHEAIVEMYKRADLTLLLTAQSFLRFTLIGIVLGVGAVDLIPSHEPQVSPFHNKLADRFFINWWYVLVTYFVVAWLVFIAGNHINSQPHDQSGASSVRRLLYLPALLDGLFITILACGVRPLPPDYHLAYILPLTGLWIFRMRWTVYLVSGLVIIGVTAAGAVHHSIWVEKQTLLDRLPEFFALTVPRLAFWIVVLSSLFSLRWLRSEEARKRKLMDAVADNLPFAVFAKNAQKEFVYMNNSLYESLRRNISDDSARKIGIEKRDDFYGYTDFELELPYANLYRMSDEKVLAGESTSQLEPNYDRYNPHSPFVFTSKSPHKRLGEVELIVGTCEEGTPHLIAKAVTEVAPYCMTLKDEMNHIRWANRAFLDKDVDIASIFARWRAKYTPRTEDAKELLTLWLGNDFPKNHVGLCDKLEVLISKNKNRPSFSATEKLTLLLAINDLHGAKDGDLYDEADAIKYFNDDIKVIDTARNNLKANKDPVKEVILKGWNQPEDHHFACGNKKAKVMVMKIPWLRSEPGGEIKVVGVAVFYHEIM